MNSDIISGILSDIFKVCGLDTYQMLSQTTFPPTISDLVEQRANAFAAAFLAPLPAVKQMFSSQSTARRRFK